MNREIKFRGLNTKGEWVYGSLISNCTGLEHMPKQNTKTWIVTSAFGHGGWFNIRGREYVLPETVGQLTPIVDDEGIQIYEGDRVRIIRADDCHGGEDTEEVVTINSPEYIELSDLSSGGPEGDFPIKSIQVIGNIHQK